jgi:hypothetical protein
MRNHRETVEMSSQVPVIEFEISTREEEIF